MIKVLRLLFKIIRFLARVIYLWYWWIPIQLGILSLMSYFGLIYLLFGTIDITEIQEILGNCETSFFLYFWVPFAVPIFLSLGACFASPVGSKSRSLDEAIRYRNGQMSVKPDKEAAEILGRTSYLDMLNSNDWNVFLAARQGFDARYGAKPPTEVFKDLMKKKENG